MATTKKSTKTIDSNKEIESTSSFEDALQNLETIVKQMEQGELSLEQSLTQFEEGVKLTQSCQQALEKAELRVQQLTQQSGALTTQDFDESKHP